MKTAISVPDDTFAKVEERAAALGMSRSEFYTQAARRYLERLDAESLTRQIDTALQLVEGEDDSSRAAVDAGRRRLASAENDW